MILALNTYDICNSSYYHHHHHIGSINLSHCCHIFPWLCARCAVPSGFRRIRWFAHYTTSLSSLCTCIWNYWTFKYSECVSEIKSILSTIFHTICVFSLRISFVMIERICVRYLIIIIKWEVWGICHCLGLGHETMVRAVCLSTCSMLLRDNITQCVDQFLRLPNAISTNAYEIWKWACLKILSV